jgi:hypothetical protein
MLPRREFPGDARTDLFTASHALPPVGNPFDDLQRDMNELELEKKVKEIMAKRPDLLDKDEPEKARQSLIDLVQTEIDRIRAIAGEHEQEAGEQPARSRARKVFVFSPETEAMRRAFGKYKSSVERRIVVLRKEIRARKAASNAQGSPPVPGKDLSPYDCDGQPASWWTEQGGGTRGDLRSRGGRGQETLAQHAPTPEAAPRAQGERNVPNEPNFCAYVCIA